MISLRTCFYYFVAMKFQRGYQMSVGEKNRVLQTSLGNQMISKGNVNSKMIDFIDNNKYLLSDNRTSFIKHEKEKVFKINVSTLKYNSWTSQVFESLLDKINLFTPFKELGNITNSNSKLDKGSINDDDMSLQAAKRRRLCESIELFDNLKKNKSLKPSDRNKAAKCLSVNVDLELVSELLITFTREDGENLLASLSTEQKRCLNTILKYAFPSDFEDSVSNSTQTNTTEKSGVDQKVNKITDMTDPIYKIIVIEGAAGCGKSAVVEGLCYYTFDKHKDYSKILYVTQTNVLCQSMRNKCSYNGDMQYMTFFKFLNILNLTFKDKNRLLMNCDAMKINAFQKTYGLNFLNDIRNFVRLPNMNGAAPPKMFIIFDEIYAVSDGKLSLFMFIVRCLKINFPSIDICCIMIGDKHQLRPFTKVENIKLVVTKSVAPIPVDGIKDLFATERLPDVTNKFNVDNNIKDDDTFWAAYISENESLSNAVCFHLKQQFRIQDSVYLNFIDMVRNCDNSHQSSLEIIKCIEKLWPEKVNETISIEYPIDAILQKLTDIKMKEYKKIVLAFEKDDLFRKTISTIVFCFTNNHAHFYNISLAFSYLKQINEKCTTANLHTTDMIAFSLIYSSYYVEKGEIRNKKNYLKSLVNRSNNMMNILPLIRYCPYKILSWNSPVASLSIVYLLDWVLNDDKSISHLVVYSRDMKYIFNIIPSKFKMNLFNNIFLYGFPLQLAFSSTFASSQGLTLDNKIAISCADISKAELYVCLTRIRKASDFVNIF